MTATALCALSLLVSSASAKDDSKGDTTPQRGDFELRYGVLNYRPIPLPNGGEDVNPIETVYNRNPHNILQIEFGPQIGRFVEFDLGIGFSQELSTSIAEGGAASTQKTMLTWWPLTADASLRAHIVDEQIFVPAVRYGFDYLLWGELTDNASGGKDRVTGAKIGHHYAFSGQILLDVLSKGRASMLEAQSGINDTYLVIEWRRQNVDQRRYPWGAPVKYGLDFTASLFTVGFKFDY